MDFVIYLCFIQKKRFIIVFSSCFAFLFVLELSEKKHDNKKRKNWYFAGFF